MTGRYDFAARRLSKRAGRERGCWIYVPAEELARSEIDPHGPAPFYRIWPARRGRIIVNLYRER